MKMVLVFVAAVGALMMSTIGVAQGGFTYVSASRSVATRVERFGTDEILVQDAKSTVNFAPFDVKSSIESPRPNPGRDRLYATADVRQQSMLTSSSITSTGNISLLSDDKLAYGKSMISVEFRLDEPTQYRYDFTAYEFRDQLFDGAYIDLAAVLTRRGTTSDIIGDRYRTPADLAPIAGPFVFDEMGVLEPGLYGLEVSLDFSSGIRGLVYSNYSFNLALTDTPAPAVPLPAAVWPGVAMLGALASRRLLCR